VPVSESEKGPQPTRYTNGHTGHVKHQVYMFSGILSDILKIHIPADLFHDSYKVVLNY
jgi:hypothetical protein